MKILSLYCGSGGIDEGLKQAGFKTTLAIDIWKDACETFKLNHPDTEVINGQVSDYVDSLSNYDVIVGGPPCPNFSRANANRNFDACEVNNFWSIVDKLNPKFYMMENVQDVIKVTNRKNYLVNVRDYGVAQDRLRRIFTNLPLPGPKEKTSMGQILKQTEFEYLTDFSFPNRNQKCPSRTMDKLAPTITTMECFYLTEVPIYTRKYLPESQHVWINKNKDGLDNGKAARKITNNERALLQGFPKDYKFYGKHDSVRKQIGNAVPPPLIKAFFEGMN